MTRFRPSRSDDHLSNYWNALVRNAPPEELARLARLVEPSEIAAIERAHAAHERYEPDPLFARRLEQTLMDTSLSSVSDTIARPHFSLPSRNEVREPGPISHRRAPAAPTRSGWTLRPALALGLAILLVIASAAGTWWVSNRQDDPQPMMAPAVVQNPEDTMAAHRDHPIVGAWDAPVGVPESEAQHGLPCWCLSVFTADGIAMAMDPRPDWRASDMASETVAFGIWQPTGERTAVSIVRFPADDEGYIERTFTWEVSEDGNSVTSTGTQRRINPDGTFATMPNIATIELVRMMMPGEEPDATPVN